MIIERKKKKREEFNDLLIPIILVLYVMPFIIRLAEYSCGYSKYPWYSDMDVVQDLYAYYRCYFFEIVAVFAVFILAFRIVLYKDKTKKWTPYFPLVVYGSMSILSTCASVNMEASLTGNFYQFQGILVILGYLVMCFYTYQILDKEQDYRTLFYGIIIVFLIMLIVGVFQIARLDLLNFSWIQRFIMSEAQFDVYRGEIDTVFTGSNVFLTLFNPNYAGVFLTMTAGIFGVMFYTEKVKRLKIYYSILFLLNLILVWFTYSRSTLVALSVELVAFLFIIKEEGKQILEYILPGLAILVGVFLLIDSLQDFKYLSRMVETQEQNFLEEMVTTEDGVLVTYNGQKILLAIKDGKPVVYDEKGSDVKSENGIENEIIIPMNEEIRAMVVEGDNKNDFLYVYVKEKTFKFGEGEEGYFYLTENQKKDKLQPIEKVNFGGYENLGSGRLYIWSRTLPLLKDYLFIGSGPDTFAEVFPQNDYVGKAIYANTSARIMEKPHNDYLLQWIQIGAIGFLGMICFYGLLLKKGFCFFYNSGLNSLKERLGMGCFMGCIAYMTGSLFNDSTLYTTPMFWCFAGIVLAASYKND